MNNGVYEHYINTKIDDGTAVAELMKYFVKTDSEDIRHGALSERVGYLKSEGKGEDYMCEIIDRLREESRLNGFAEGKEEGKEAGKEEGILKTAEAMLRKGYSIEEVLDITELSIEKVKRLAEA